MKRESLLRQVDQALGNRRLIWFGTRGEDARSLGDVKQFEASFSLIAPMPERPWLESRALEDISGIRPDLDTYDIDDELRTDAVRELRREILRATSRPSAMITYRPTRFLSAIGFSRQDRCRYLGMFKDHHAAFEHKPWLETTISGSGQVPCIPWTYMPDIERLNAERLLDDGPIMLRRSRSAGGVGLVKVDEPSQIEQLWFDEDEAFVSVAPFLDGGVSVNAGGVVWADRVTLHPASVQLIGVPGLTTREFGYCGNDFGAFTELGDEVIEQVERSTQIVGSVLRDLGFLGAFGVDYLVIDGVPLFTEVNPRFQGSTHASCRLSVEQGESCLVLEHLAAFLRLEGEDSASLRDQARAVGDLAHLVVHHDGPTSPVEVHDLLERSRELTGFVSADVLPRDGAMVEPGGAVARITFRDRVTDDGHCLRGVYETFQA